MRLLEEKEEIAMKSCTMLWSRALILRDLESTTHVSVGDVDRGPMQIGCVVLRTSHRVQVDHQQAVQMSLMILNAVVLLYRRRMLYCGRL